MNIPALLEAFWSEYSEGDISFEDVENKRSNRPDLHVFLLLDHLLPDTDNIVGWAEHDIIHLNVDIAGLEKVATHADVLELAACGVSYDEETDSLTMFAG